MKPTFRAVLCRVESSVSSKAGVVSNCCCPIRCYPLSVIMTKRCCRQRRSRRTTRTSSLVGLRSGQTRLQTTRRAQPFINADVLQIITEYTAQISSILCQRRVSKLWYGAVTEAIGFLNGRDWGRLEWWSVRLPKRLSTHFPYADSEAIVRFMAVCLRERLETLVITRPPAYNTRREGWSLRLLCERNDCLKHLHLRYIDVRDVAVLGRCSALELLHFEDCTLDVHDVRIFVEMHSLKRLGLSGCQPLDLSLRHPRAPLRRQNLDGCDFWGNGSIAVLSQITALTSLSLSYCSNVTNVSPLSSCLALEELILTRTGVDAAGIEGLERIPTLRRLYLWECRQLRDVTCLQRCVSLETLALKGSPVTGMGIRGLENIPGLRSLNIGASDVSTVVGLTSCNALKWLELYSTDVDDAGIAGLENIASLTHLDLKGCSRITSVCSLRMSRSIWVLNLSDTGITAAGLVGLNEIPTLEIVALENCRKLTDVRSLRGCPSLCALWVAGTPLAAGGLEGLESVAHSIPA
jgi:Leucine-rich repeat (LRR) protein